jgi:hypothetical protein
MKCSAIILLSAFVVLALVPRGHGDEGMWLFNNPPRKYLKDKYGFDITDDWLLHVQRASVRFNSGGSGSFISPDGLVMTNHHVGADALQKLSTEKHDYLKTGYQAKTRAQELECEATELNVLMSIEDVTARVKAAVKPGMSPAKAFAARRAVINEIEQESFKATGLRSNVITLYQGGAYNLYRFKKYTDVRLVFAPEQQAAFFGGDPDNFEYPRYDLDICFFRVYEDGKPAKIEHYLEWSKAGPSEDELVFVSGHPGRTERLATVAELEYLRDTGFPFYLQRMYRWEVLLSVFSERSEENAREAKDFLFGVKNSRKARRGGLAALLDPDLMKRKKAEERRLKAKANSDKSLADARTAWERIAGAQKVRARNIRKYTLLEAGAGFNSQLFSIARTLVRAADERAKPNAQRMREYVDSSLPSLEEQLFSREPIYDGYEIVKLADALTFLSSEMGHENPLVKKVLAGKSPRDRAAELVRGTKVKAVAERKRLYKGGKKAIHASKDPMILLAKLVDPESRKVREVIESQVQEVQNQAYADIAKVKFALEGTDTYPDATFTLRLAFGVVKGYEEDGKQIPYETTFAGMYEHAKAHGYKPPWDLPERWLKKKDELDLKTGLNFLCTADIIGGNSGSPVINRKGELVGLIFDGNIYSLVLDFAYTEKKARAISVHSAGILEALTKVYGANRLVAEIRGKAR